MRSIVDCAQEAQLPALARQGRPMVAGYLASLMSPPSKEQRDMSRAIDRHEDAICAAHDAAMDGMPWGEAIRLMAPRYGLTEDRLRQLTTMWCALAQLDGPQS